MSEGDYMQYSDYNLNEIEKIPIFRELSKMFFELVDSETKKEKLESILYDGGYKNYSLNSNMSNKDNPYIEMRRRVSMAYLLIRNEDTFDELVTNNINLFHGTNSKALSGILENGLESTELLKEREYEISTGEKYSRTEYVRDLDFVSLTDIVDIAEDYSDVSYEEEAEGIFNVIIGTNAEAISGLKKCIVSSDVAEIGVERKLPLECIKMIGVPTEKVEYVRNLINNDNIKVLGIDGVGERFYCIDSIQTDIYKEDFEKVREKIRNSNGELNRMMAELSVKESEKSGKQK